MACQLLTFVMGTAVEVELLVFGSGVAALTVIAVAKRRGLRTLVVDPDPSFGASIAYSTERDIAIQRVPVLLTLQELEALSIPKSCALELNVEPIVLKEGDYRAKVCGYSSKQYQTPWPLRWVEKRDTLYYVPNLLDYVVNVLGLSRKDILSHVVSNLRVIDLSKRVAVLSLGTIIRFRNAVWTWPCDTLFRHLAKRDREELSELSKNLEELEFVGMHILSVASIEHRKPTMYIHATKASRMHTAITIPISDNISLTYAITSFSRSYPLLPGITEKLLSELRRFHIVDVKKIAVERVYTTMYGALPEGVTLEKLVEELQCRGLILWGRLALLREISVVDIIGCTEKIEELLFR